MLYPYVKNIIPKLETEYCSQCADGDCAIATVVIRVENELQIWRNTNVVRDGEAIEQFQIGLGGITHLALKKRLSHRDRSHSPFFKQIWKSRSQ